jgi:hypothetical protein
MKASAFETLIRKVVREEIDYALRREIKTLKEDLRDELKPTIVEHTQRLTKVPESVQHSLKEKIMGKKPISKNFTTDGTLNDLLNETAQGNTNTESPGAPVSLSQPFDSASPMPVEAMPAEVANVVNKDYRELMRAMDKKKNSRP